MAKGIINLHIGHKPDHGLAISVDGRESSTGAPETQDILPNGLGSCPKNEGPRWYSAWLSAQFNELPAEVFDIFHSEHEHCTPGSHWDLFVSAFLAIAESIVSTSNITIDGVIIQLLDKQLMPTDASPETLQYARYFIFSVLGWQTMLFQPARPTDQPQQQPQPPQQLAINEQRGCCEFTHMDLQQPMGVCAHEPLSELLMGFGILLPATNICLNDDPDVQQVFHHRTEVNAKTFNAYSLSSIAGIRIKWVDALACHLEFNSTTKELSLFRFPSFCLLSLESYARRRRRGCIHACATTSKLRCQWATEEDVDQLLREILLSYRLLFAQTKKARRVFRAVDPFAHGPRESRDLLLGSLCGKRKNNDDRNNNSDMMMVLCGLGVPLQKETYCLPRDFPVLRYRITVLQRLLDTTTARTWAQLWRDKRDSANWLTFWAVIFFGAFGSLMAFMQVVLQFVQLFVT
ncbi:hypothetical protein BO70DRAFT_336008 [Aspergillus heteromorphus CBS 117.55]|uniref:Uncharacterized protein n=1 Tax=Aspergillus heteromorphus CBS 117.55 TaxID=1448321 RepID=A0A317WAJ9_9EURO|nr:uncharacterized protein BO70DRAFT_336008 [Aspergillus heteromorphus CBS 117.55]PWY82925.1 hypothetical protein BO70DRAFT_336008 [Aspergillus heteromorphus CBS 117.55]